MRARVINTSSPSGVFGNVGQTNYGAAKAGIAAFTIIAAQELGRYGVTVNCLAPNARTRMTEETFEMGAPPEGFDPLDPANNSPVVVALCADEAQGITGQCFHVWGGAVNALRPWDGRASCSDSDGALGRGRAPRRAARALPGRRRARGDGRRHAEGRRPLAAHAVSTARRRIYLMRHAQVRYFEGLPPEEVVLTDEGRRQAQAAAEALAGVAFDRVITSGLARTLETARIVAPGREPESRHELREIESGDIRGLDPDEVQAMMAAAFRGAVPLETRFLGGETIGALLDRVLPELDALLADTPGTCSCSSSTAA